MDTVYSKILENEMKELKNVKTKLNKIDKEIDKRVPKEVAKMYLSIANDAVKSFYSDYSPIYYKRTNQLYNAYTVDVKNGEYPESIRYTPDNLHYSSGIDGDDIIETTLVYGYHGGTLIDGVSYWGHPYIDKSGKLKFTKGNGKVAYRSSSPKEYIDKTIGNLYDQGFVDVINKVFDELWEE